MKTKVCLLFAFMAFLSFGLSAHAEQPPYELIKFDTVDELIDWINTVDIETVDDWSGWPEDHKIFIEAIRKDGEIILPKYKGKYIPVYGVFAWPYYEPKVNSIAFGTISDIWVDIYRIDDDNLNFAKNDYEKYIAQGDPFVSIGRFVSPSSGRYKMIDRYDVFVGSRDPVDESFFDDFSFDKVSLSNPDETVASYSFKDSLEYHFDYYEPQINPIVFYVIGFASAGIISVVSIILFRKRKRTRKTKGESA